MIAKGIVLVFGGDPQAAYATGGVWKPTHAVAMHAILVLLALAWLLSFTGWSERRRLRFVCAGSAGYAIFAGLIAVRNFADLGPVSAPVTAAALLGLLLTAILVGTLEFTRL